MRVATMAAADPGFSPARVLWLAAALTATGAILELAAAGSVWGALSLSFSGAVAMINFHWLEGLVDRVARPGRPRFGGGEVMRTALRLGLLGTILVALVALPKIDAIGVALGFSTVVIAVLAEAFRWAVKGGDGS